MEGKGPKIALGVIAAVVVIGGGILLFNMNNSNNQEETATTQVETAITEPAAPELNIVETAVGNPDFSTLVTALQTAGLVDTLSGEGPFTVFAPTNAAFDKLPAGTLDSLLADPAALRDILTYHVVSGNVKAADVVKLTTATTVNGKSVNITVNGNTVKINDATVTTTDIATRNGTIHVIDTVLLPPAN